MRSDSEKFRLSVPGFVGIELEALHLTLCLGTPQPALVMRPDFVVVVGRLEGVEVRGLGGLAEDPHYRRKSLNLKRKLQFRDAF